MEIIPAIDIIEGKCVRLTQGDYDLKTIYNEHPLEVAREFEGNGIRRLHLVDLDGAKKGKVVNQKVLEQIASKTNLIIDFGGGIKSDGDMKSIFNAGAAIAAIGSIAVKNKDLFWNWLNTYGPDKLMLGADVKDEKIAIHGWQETAELSIVDFLKEHISKGVKQAFCTDVSKDGLLQGPATDLYKSILQKFPDLKLIASGGVSEMNDLYKLSETGCSGVIIGKAIYEGRISLQDLKQLL